MNWRPAIALVLLGLALGAGAWAQVAEGQGAWSVKAPMPGGPRAELPAVAVAGKVYAVRLRPGTPAERPPIVQGH